MNIPSKLFSMLQDLNPEFFVARYPDAANGIPAYMFNEESARIHLEKAREVIKWVEKKIKE